jgi:hypothetical protein
MSVVQSVVSDEMHSMVVEMRQDAGGAIRASQQIILTGVSSRLNSFWILDMVTLYLPYIFSYSLL